MNMADFAQSINIRSIQHFLYCPHRWALIELDRIWAENGSVVHANLLHEFVHDGSHKIQSTAKIALSDVTVYSDKLNLYGVLDCIEFIPDKNGCEICGYDGKYRVNIVEYKPSAPKKDGWRFEDAMQVYAQKLCIDEHIPGCDCNGFIYYSDTKRRVEIMFDKSDYDFQKELLKAVGTMQEYIKSGFFPPAEYGKKCNGCSLFERCIPKIKFRLSVKEMIQEEIIE